MDEKKQIHRQNSGTEDNVELDKITNIYINTSDFKELQNQLTELKTKKNKLREKIVKCPDNENFKADLLKVDADLAEQGQKIESFKANVFRLYETFTKVEINTQRLYFAEAFFKTGKFKEADALLNDKEPIKTYLSDVATAFKKISILHYDNNEFADAESVLNEALHIYRELAQDNPITYMPKVAMTLNNLANIQKDRIEFAAAEQNFKEALEIYRGLAIQNPEIYLPEVAMTLNNFAILQKSKKELSDAEKKYDEALQIYRELAKGDSKTYLPDVAMTLNNLANIQTTRDEFAVAEENFQEALKIRREFAKKDPRTYLRYVASTLNNLALLQKNKNEFAVAEENYQEALEIRRELAKEKPEKYLPDVSMTIINLSIFYLRSVPNKEKSIALANEALEMLLPVYKQIPYLENYLKFAVQVLQENGVDLDTIKI